MSLNVTTEPRENRQLAITVEVDQARVDQELRKAARKVAKDYRIPGFRPGKAPYNVVVQQFGLPNLYREFVDQLAEEMYKSAIEQEGIQPYAQAALEDVKLEPLTYTLLIPLEPEVKLGDYRTLRVEEDAPQVDETAINERLEQYREQNSGWNEVTRPSAYGDTLNIDVKSVIVPEEGATDAEETVVLNENDWDVTPDQENPMEPAGFDEELLGLTPGEEKTFNLTWPADSQSVHAGKTARFNVKINGIKAFEKPELDDAFAQLVGPDFATLDDLKAKIHEELLTQAKASAEETYTEKALDEVLSISQLEYAPVVVEDQIDSMVSEFDRQLRQFGIEGVENYLKQVGQTLEDYRERLRPDAQKLAERNLILSEILRTESLQASDAEVEERIIAMLGGEEAAKTESAQSVLEQLRDGSSRAMIESQVLREKALQRLLAIVRGEEVPAPGASDEATSTPTAEAEDSTDEVAQTTEPEPAEQA
ncbi:trigger factor [soil metagenome]